MDELVFFFPDGHEAHNSPGHVERPDRLAAVNAALDASGLRSQYPFLEPAEVSEEVLQQIHTERYLAQIEAAARESRSLDPDTYTTPASFKLALNSAGGAISVARAVWSGEAQKGFALCRPPGHHAMRDRGMGFCLLNNVALAAGDLRFSSGANRLAVIDLDLHHGNGTQDIFYLSKDIFYASTHRFPFYPGSGRLDETGAGPGEGSTANFPLPAGAGDIAIATIIQRLILPLLDRFEPQMLLVSAGFDTHWLDPLGDMLMTAAGYGRTIQLLNGWAEQHCSGRMTLFLEGGYDLQAVASCTLACSAGLLGESWDDSLGDPPFPENESWREMMDAGIQLWKLQ